MKISYIIPHKDRTELLEANLQSLASQTSSDFEVIIVDNSSVSGADKLNKLVKKYRTHSLKIRAVLINPSIHPNAHPISEYGGGYNPALSQNIGAKLATGDVLCLTSPEVINASTNVEVAKAIFSDDRNKFVLGWIDERPRHLVGDLSSGISVQKIKEICKIPGNGAMCRDDAPNRPWLPINYFLGFIKKSDFLKVGGIEEGFMRSIAWEDDFFAHCCSQNGFPAEINTDIAGIHLAHPRGYQASLDNYNKRLWAKLKEESATVANNGKEWGSDSYICGEF